MATPSEQRHDSIWTGRNDFGGPVTVPGGSWDNEDIAGDAGIETSKMLHRHAVQYGQAGGADVAAATVYVHIAKAAGTVHSLRVATNQKPTGDRTFTVDVQKSTGGGAFATILTGVVTINASSTDRVPAAGVLDAGEIEYDEDDIFRVVIALGGSTGNHAQGMIVSIRFNEEPS